MTDTDTDTYARYLSANWPVPGSTELFNAMRAVVVEVARTHGLRDFEIAVLEQIARGDIKVAVRKAVDMGVPRDAIYSPILLLIGTAETRKVHYDPETISAFGA
jgi:hypothetical protein